MSSFLRMFLQITFLPTVSFPWQTLTSHRWLSDHIFKEESKPGIVVHSCNLSQTQDARKFEGRLGYESPCF